jgi:hypothetical protein
MSKLNFEPREGMDKSVLLNLFANARKRAERGDLNIAAQNEVVTALEQRGIDATMAKAILARIIVRQAANLTEMDRLLDKWNILRGKSVGASTPTGAEAMPASVKRETHMSCERFRTAPLRGLSPGGLFGPAGRREPCRPNRREPEGQLTATKHNLRLSIGFPCQSCRGLLHSFSG